MRLIDYDPATGESVVTEVPDPPEVAQRLVRDDLHAKARAALAANAAFLADPSPSNGEVLAQVRRMARQNNALIRLLIGADLLVGNGDT